MAFLLSLRYWNTMKMREKDFNGNLIWFSGRAFPLPKKSTKSSWEKRQTFFKRQFISRASETRDDLRERKKFFHFIFFRAIRTENWMESSHLRTKSSKQFFRFVYCFHSISVFISSTQIERWKRSAAVNKIFTPNV